MPHPTHYCLSAKISIILLLLLTPALAWAEVSDKEPTVASIWALTALAVLVCGFATYWRKALAVLTVIPILWFVGIFVEIHSKFIYPALLQEQGISYFAQVYCAFALLILAVVTAFFLNLRIKKEK